MYTRTNLLVGSANIEKIKTAQVAVFGLGGVGSYVAESLARSGIGNLILVDADVLVASNINRQLPALNSTLGRLKTEVVRQRLLDINPSCQVEILSKFYYPGDFEKYKRITGVDDVQDSIVFHAGTTEKDGDILTSGGRVMAITSVAENFQEAIRISLKNAEKIHFEGKYFRRDIGFDL